MAWLSLEKSEKTDLCFSMKSSSCKLKAKSLFLIPSRRYVSRSWKCRSTPTGTLPTDEDLFDAVKRGYNTYMPSWIALTNQQRADLVAFSSRLFPRAGKGEGGRAAQGSLRARTFAPEHPAWQRAVYQAGMLEVPWPRRPQRRPLRFHAYGQQRSEDAWDLVPYLRTLQVTNKSPELTLWMSTKEGAEYVKAQKSRWDRERFRHQAIALRDPVERGDAIKAYLFFRLHHQTKRRLEPRASHGYAIGNAQECGACPLADFQRRR